VSDQRAANGGVMAGVKKGEDRQPNSWLFKRNLTSGRECEAEGVGLEGGGEAFSPARNTNGQRSD